MRKTNLKKSIVAASVAAGIAGGLVAGLALGVPGFAGAQANNSPLNVQGSSAVLAKSAVVTLSDTIQVPSVGASSTGAKEKGPKLETVAKVLGVTAEELKTELATKSLADVAAAKGVDITKVIDALVAEFKAHLDEEVASGEHTQAEADAKLAEFKTRVTDMVNNVRPAGGPEGRGHRGPGKGHGMGHGPKLEAAAKVLGMTTEELKTELATKSLADVAAAKGVDITKVTDALVAEFKAHLDEEVASGEHTQAEADAILAAFTTRVADMVNNVRPAGGPEGRGHGGPGKGHGMGHGPKLEAVAKVLGVTAEELKTELATKSLADVAAAKGVDITKVIDALVAEFKAHLDEEVASGEHTQAEADAKLAEFTTRVTDMVNNVRPAGGPEGRGHEGRGPRGHGGPGMGRGMGHGPDADSDAMAGAPALQGSVTVTPSNNA
jgi:lipoate-protein ligase A